MFRYLRDFNLHRNPAKRLLQEQLWRLALEDLPDHSSIERGALAEDGDDEGGLGVPPEG